MSRRRRTEESSLDLLLDTITNTFGGILFLAILVSLLLQPSTPNNNEQATPTAQPMSAAEQAAYEVRIEDLQDQVSRLQQKRISVRDTRSESADKFTDVVTELVTRLARAIEDKARVSLETGSYQRDRAVAADETARLKQRQFAAAERHTSAERARDAASAESKELERLGLTLEHNEQPTTIEQIAGMPTLHSTEKQQVAIYVRFGKLFMMHAWRNGVRQGPNPKHFVVLPGNPPLARPKPGAGITVTADTITMEVLQLLRQFPPARWVVAVVIFDDSFEKFQLVKRAIVEAGYEYNPIPLKRGESLFDSGGNSVSQ